MEDWRLFAVNWATKVASLLHELCLIGNVTGVNVRSTN